MQPYGGFPPSPFAAPAAVQLRVPQSRPVLTYVILGVNILVFLASAVIGQETALWLGAKINQFIVAGQYWRLGTAIFLHANLLHILFNSYALYALGPGVERPYGSFRFLIAYLMSGLAGSSLSFLLSPYPSVGASGAIFGLIGVTGIYLYHYRDRLVAGRARLANIIGIVAYNLLFGFVSTGVDNWAHIGGLLAGIVLGWFLIPRYAVQTDWLGVPRLVDLPSRARWLTGIVIVGLGILLTVAAGLLRWG